MVKYLIVRSYCNPEFYSVSVCDNILEHYLKFRDNEIKLQTNLFVGIVKDNFNKLKELPSKYVCEFNEHFYSTKILDYLHSTFNKKLVITKEVKVMLIYLRFIEKKMNIRYVYDFDDKIIYREDIDANKIILQRIFCKKGK
jgi:hypothetical protein